MEESSNNNIGLFQSSIPSDFDAKLKAISEKDIGRIDDTIVFSKKTPKVFQVLGLPKLPFEIYLDKLAR